MHKYSSFITLTYKDAPLELQPRDLQLFWKRLRANYPAPLRYFAVGEYGDKGGRPHYHAAVFGLSMMHGEVVNQSWGLGFTHIGELNKDTADYLCGYVTKKMTKKDDPRLAGKHPEFTRSSRGKGTYGIGVPALTTLAEALNTEQGKLSMEAMGDIPYEVVIHGKTVPLGRTLRSKLRVALGREPTEPQAKKRQRAALYKAEPESARETRREQHYNRARSRASNYRGKRKL